MPTLNITNDQFRTSLQAIQNRYIKLELLNYNYQKVDEIEGTCMSGNISINADSDIRRTANIVLAVQGSSFEVRPGGKIWLDKYIRLWVGTENLNTGSIEWINCGMYIIDAPNYSYDAINNSLSLTLLDMMAKLTGMRNGYLPGIPATIKAGENIREAIIDTLAMGGFTKYVVEEAPSPGTVPNDLEFDQGATVYTLLSALRDIYPSYEMYFDINGVFYYKPIPTGDNDPIMFDDSLWDKITISEDLSVDFQNIKNVIEVYGKTHDPEHYSDTAEVSGSTIELSIEDVEEYTEDIIYGFTIKNTEEIKDATLRINSLTTRPIRLSDGTTPVTIPALPEGKEEEYYCIQYKGAYWFWLGHLQAYGYAEDDNEDSPFYIKSTIGEIRLPLYGGDYENCFSDELAQERAEYELYVHSQMNDTITISAVPVYYLDVNLLVSYTLRRSDEMHQYLLKTIDMGLAPADVMNVTMMRYYPTQEYAVDNNTVLLLHGDDFVDSSPAHRGVQSFDVTISEDQHKFGSSSFAFNGTSAYLLVEPYNFDSNDFTIDWWEYCNEGMTGDSGTRFSSAFTPGETLGGLNIGMNQTQVHASSTFGTTDDTWNILNDKDMISVTVNTWTHWAFVRSGSTLKAYKDGKQFASVDIDGAIAFDSHFLFAIGNSREGAPSYFNGYINEFRISNVARWTTDFTPQTEPY